MAEAVDTGAAQDLPPKRQVSAVPRDGDIILAQRKVTNPVPVDGRAILDLKTQLAQFQADSHSSASTRVGTVARRARSNVIPIAASHAVNKGIANRIAQDAAANWTESRLLDHSAQRLEEKARLYDDLASGIYQDHQGDYEVDFLAPERPAALQSVRLIDPCSYGVHARSPVAASCHAEWSQPQNTRPPLHSRSASPPVATTHNTEGRRASPTYERYTVSTTSGAHPLRSGSASPDPARNAGRASPTYEPYGGSTTAGAQASVVAGTSGSGQRRTSDSPPGRLGPRNAGLGWVSGRHSTPHPDLNGEEGHLRAAQLHKAHMAGVSARVAEWEKERLAEAARYQIRKEGIREVEAEVARGAAAWREVAQEQARQEEAATAALVAEHVEEQIKKLKAERRRERKKRRLEPKAQ